ncbi:MAG: BolA family protein [Moritella sp.]|uniref:BolA family protein n=1 Tax=Moritella sp. TaxID=78556 RepID=UPI0029A18834|nr:BolA family protein [Moritella sp.]MDX2320582.1 BolA family protein [Moritella sp.]
MSLGNDIKQQLLTSFDIQYLDVVCDSHKHNVPPGTEIHFSVVIVAAEFDNKMLIARHRMVNTALEAQFAAGIHALSIHAYTSDQWAKKMLKNKKYLSHQTV